MPVHARPCLRPAPVPPVVAWSPNPAAGFTWPTPAGHLARSIRLGSRRARQAPARGSQSTRQHNCWARGGSASSDPPPRPRLPLPAFSSVNSLSEAASLLGLGRDCLGPPLSVVPEARQRAEPASYYRVLH